MSDEQKNDAKSKDQAVEEKPKDAPVKNGAPAKNKLASPDEKNTDKKRAISDQPDKSKSADKKTKGPKVTLAETKVMLSKLVKSVRKHPDDMLIMVPVDFSKHSEAALKFGAKLADNLSASLLVLHVVHDPGEMPGYYAKLVKKKRVERIQDIARDVFCDFLKEAIEENPKRKSLRTATNLMVIGLPVTRILQMSDKVDPFLVVMGSKGRTGLKHLFLGSKAEQVVQLCKAPVTIVKQDTEQKKKG